MMNEREDSNLTAGAPICQAPRLDAPAIVGATLFNTGVSWTAVIERAQREFRFRHFGDVAQAAGVAVVLDEHAKVEITDIAEDDAALAALAEIRTLVSDEDYRRIAAEAGHPVGGCPAANASTRGASYADDPSFPVDDRAMLTLLMEAFESQAWVCQRCGHEEDTKTMDSASMLRDYLAAHPAVTTPSEASNATDSKRLDWLQAHAHTLYTSNDPVTRKAVHFVAVDETNVPRTGRVRPTVREAIDACMPAQGGGVEPGRSAPGLLSMAAIYELVQACEAEFTSDATERREPDERKVALPEDRCHITFGHIRRARAALEAFRGCR